ncbi:MAG TPA: TetR/AcrR family transcriptional regulator [Burkholderiales bacterium]
MRKGERTKSAILNHAVATASQLGLEGLSIGSLADRLEMSKSGLFAHFGSKEDLQIAVVHQARQMFSDHVFTPALHEPAGLPRLSAIVQNWVTWTRSADLPGGCPITAAAYEYDDRPGALRDLLSQTLRELRKTLARSVRVAVEAGHLRVGTEPEQLAFEILGIYLASQLEARLFGDPEAWPRGLASFETLIDRYRTGTQT